MSFIRSKSLFHFVLLLCVGRFSALAWSGEADIASVQILTFDDGVLVNQGSGVIVTEAVVLTSAHLLEGASRYVVRDEAGINISAQVQKSWPEKDVAALTIKGQDKAVRAAVFAKKPAAEEDKVAVIGFWVDGLERKRDWSLFGPKRPKFVAQELAQPTRATGYVKTATQEQLLYYASIGRGAYGAPVFNECNEVVALTHLPPGFTLEQAWNIHQPATPLSALTSAELISLLKSVDVEVTVATSPCLNVVDRLKVEQAAAEKAKENAAKKEAEKTKKAIESAKKETESAKQEAEAAKKSNEETQKDSMETIENLSDRLTVVTETSEVEKAVFTNKMWVLAGLVLLLVIVIVVVWIKRTKDLSKANVRYSDCLLQGVDSARNPVALRISGLDLARSSNGVIIGRNPEGTGVVLADETVSRNHARLSLQQGRLFLEDMRSANGTRLNGVLLIAGQPTEIQNGDRIDFGSAVTELKVLTS